MCLIYGTSFFYVNEFPAWNNSYVVVDDWLKWTNGEQGWALPARTTILYTAFKMLMRSPVTNNDMHPSVSVSTEYVGWHWRVNVLLARRIGCWSTSGKTRWSVRSGNQHRSWRTWTRKCATSMARTLASTAAETICSNRETVLAVKAGIHLGACHRCQRRQHRGMATHRQWLVWHWWRRIWPCGAAARWNWGGWM